MFAKEPIGMRDIIPNLNDTNIASRPATELEYLSDTYLFVSKSAFVSATPRDDGVLDVVLERTIFYPKGGGQPSDTGRIVFENGELAVRNVTLKPDGVVSHACSLVSGHLPQPGDAVELQIDSEGRLRNARSHTAGHLIDLAMQLLSYRRDAIKANHSPSESWIQFNGDDLPSGVAVGDIQRELSEVIQRLIKEDIPIKQFIPSAQEAIDRGASAPPGKSVRLVAFEGYESLARGCGGTHVRSTSEVGEVSISGVRARKGILSVTYEIHRKN